MGLTTWPTIGHLGERLAAAGVTPRDGVSLQGAIDAVVAEVARETRQQFIVDGVDTVRLYDGSGLGQMTVEAMVSLTSVVAHSSTGDGGTPLLNVVLVVEQGRPMTKLAFTQSGISGDYFLPTFGFAPTGAYHVDRILFPAGRENISVTGRFGYAATIPDDVWQAVCSEAAYRIAYERFGPVGRVLSREIDGARISYSNQPLVWHQSYIDMLASYSNREARRRRLFRNAGGAVI